LPTQSLCFNIFAFGSVSRWGLQLGEMVVPAPLRAVSLNFKHNYKISINSIFKKEI
jgi:hypothetical protein